MATTVGTGDLFGGGSAPSGVSNTGNSNMDTGSGNFNTSLDLSSLQSIQGHTIIDGMTASDVSGILSVANQNTIATVTNAASSAVNSISESVSSIFHSSGFKWALFGIGALVAYFIFKKKK